MIDTKHVLVRVRPQRVAVLLAEDADRKEFNSVIGFLSRLWGGRYCPIIVVTEADNDVEAKLNLSLTRPDVVILAGVDESKWVNISEEICQPKRLAVLDQNLIKQLYEVNPLRFITTHCILRHAWRQTPNLQRDSLVLHTIDSESDLSPFLAASFGLIPDNDSKTYADRLNARVSEFTSNCSTSLYLQSCTKMSKTWCWLDYASIYLTNHQFGGDFVLPPTVVVTTDKVSDCALFWNLRMQVGVGSSGYIVQFPVQDIENTTSVDALSEWISNTPVNSNYCVLRTSAAQETCLQRLARRLRPRLKKSRIDHVDIETETPHIPIIIPYERESHERIYVSGQRVNFDIVQPALSEDLGEFDEWICDIVKDVQTNRALCELFPPPRKSAIQVLNAPFPPSFSTDRHTFGIGIDSFNVKCNRRTPTLTIGIPEERELLEEILLERGIKIKKDEKRIRYVQTIEMFGGLKEAFRAFSGNSLRIIKTLRKNRDPLTLDQVQQESGIKDLPQQKGHVIFKLIDKYIPEHAKNIARKRFEGYFRQSISIDTSVIDILQELAEHSIVRRKWKLSKCPICDKNYWLDDIDINRPLYCPGCRKTIHMDRICLAYELNALVDLAVKEGIIPVVLTANFLYNTTSKGFQWLPGVKCQMGSLKTDFDIFASCDGHIIAAECKTFKKTSKDIWEKTTHQLKKSIAVGKKAGVEVFIVAALCKVFPIGFQQNIKKLAGSDMSVAFLNTEDLQKGQRDIFLNGHKTSLSIENLLPAYPQNEKKKKLRRGKRYITF